MNEELNNSPMAEKSENYGKDAGSSAAPAAPVVPKVRRYRTPPTMVNSKFKREPGQMGRPPVYHEFLVAVSRRLRKYPAKTKPVPNCWHRLSRFSQEVLFLTLAGYSPHFICKVFLEELPKVYPTLSPEGAEYSVKRVLSNARNGTMLLDEDLRKLLFKFKAGPWAPDAEDWLKEQYLVEEEMEWEAGEKQKTEEVSGSSDASVGSGESPFPVAVEEKPHDVPAVPVTSAVVAPVALEIPETIAPVPVVAPVGVERFFTEWDLFRKTKPSVGEPTEEEFEIGMSGGLSAVLAFRKEQASSGRVPVADTVETVKIVEAVASPEDVVSCRGENDVQTDCGGDFDPDKFDGFHEENFEDTSEECLLDPGISEDIDSSRQSGEAASEEVVSESEPMEFVLPEVECIGPFREDYEEDSEGSLLDPGISEDTDSSRQSGEAASEEVVSESEPTEFVFPEVECIGSFREDYEEDYEEDFEEDFEEAALLKRESAIHVIAEVVQEQVSAPVEYPVFCDWQIRGESMDQLLMRDFVKLTTADVRTYVPDLVGETYEERLSSWENFDVSTVDMEGMYLFPCDRERLEILPKMGLTFKQIYGGRTLALTVRSLMFEEIIEKIFTMESGTISPSGRRFEHYATVWTKDAALEMEEKGNHSWYLPLNPLRVESRRPKSQEEIPDGYIWVPFLGLMTKKQVIRYRDIILKGDNMEHDTPQLKELETRYATQVYKSLDSMEHSLYDHLYFGGSRNAYPLGFNEEKLHDSGVLDLEGKDHQKRFNCSRCTEAVSIFSSLRFHINDGSFQDRHLDA